MFGITWAHPKAFILLLLLIPIIGILIYNIMLKHKRVLLLTGNRIKQLLTHYSQTKSWIKALLLACSLVALILAYARPQWNEKEELVEHHGRDVLIGLDISKSMLAQDVKPNRLLLAKEKIKKLVNALNTERVGLLLFSGTAFIQCPLTADHSAFFMFLDQVDAEAISSGTTALDQAVKKAIAVFDAVPGRKNKLLVLATDGEDFSRELSGVKQQAVNQNLHIFTMGVGTTERAPIPNIDAQGKQDGHIKDSSGAVVISRLNEPMLQSIAQESGGVYVQMQEKSSGDIASIVDKVKQYEQEKLNEKKMPHLDDQYNYFVLIAFVCALLEWLL